MCGYMSSLWSEEVKHPQTLFEGFFKYLIVSGKKSLLMIGGVSALISCISIES